jgi:hypothetical protein
MRASPYCTFDDSHWPLLFHRFVGEASNQEFEDHLIERTRFLRRGQPHVLIVDLSRTGQLPPEQRKRHTEWLRQHDEVIQRMVLGTAYITPTALSRLALSVLFYLKRPSYSYLLTSQEDQALPWAINRLEAAGLPEPADRIRRELGLVSRSRAG